MRGVTATTSSILSTTTNRLISSSKNRSPATCCRSKTDEQWAENLIATTFLAIGPKNVNEQNRVQFAADLVDEQIDTTTRVFLGMSVACARCHDHKFDAIPQTDYYAMAGIFGSTLTYFGNPPSEYGIVHRCASAAEQQSVAVAGGRSQSVRQKLLTARNWPI